MKKLLILTLTVVGFAAEPAKIAETPRLTEDGLIAMQLLAVKESEMQKKFVDEVATPRKKVVEAQCKRAGLPLDCEVKQDGTLVAKKLVTTPAKKD